jgi:hypothetical protein
VRVGRQQARIENAVWLLPEPDSPTSPSTSPRLTAARCRRPRPTRAVGLRVGARAGSSQHEQLVAAQLHLRGPGRSSVRPSARSVAACAGRLRRRRRLALAAACAPSSASRRALPSRRNAVTVIAIARAGQRAGSPSGRCWRRRR